MHVTASESVEPLPPNDTEAEACVLASILMAPQLLSEVRGILTRDSFYQPDYQAIFESMLAVDDAGKPAGPLIVRDHLIGRKLFEEVGGSETMIRLYRDTHFTSNQIHHFAAIVAEKARLRELIRLCEQTRQRCMAATRQVEPARQIAANLERGAAHVMETGWADTVQSLEQIVHRVIESKEAKAIERFPTGLSDLDELIGGLPIGCMTLVAGRAGMGKSQLCKQIARNFAENGGGAVGIIAIEESAQKIGENYLAGFSGIENQKIVYNRISPEEWPQLTGAVPRMAPLKLYVDDAQQRMSDICRTARRLVTRFGCRMIVVDHLHLIDAESEVNRVQQVTLISGGLKRLFKELKVAGVVAAQMNRGGGAENDAPPELWNLRDSGSLEQDGDLIIQLHRQDYYAWKKMGNGFVPDHRLRVYVNKNKGGNVGWRDTYFDGDMQTVIDWNDGHGPYGSPDPFARPGGRFPIAVAGPNLDDI